jgi:aryl-alcohol dehydrogenase-like predicted oxidoreductase
VDAEGVAAILGQARESGVNFIDTSDTYSRGVSEEYIGRVTENDRQWWIIATKVNGAMGDGPNDVGNSRKHIMDGVEASLRRLRTDYIDLYQIHRWDSTTPIEETLGVLDDLVHEGKVRYIGCSNFAAWQLVESLHTSKSMGWHSFISVQPQYNMLSRDIERELIPAAQKYGVGIIPFSPLAGGLLTGKYKKGEAPPSGARLSAGPQAQRVLTDRNFSRTEKLEAWAQEHGHTLGELAIAWLLGQPMMGSVIAGATRPEQVADNARAADWKLSDQELEEVRAILTAPDF